jgi:hypothetical protein
MYGDKMIKTHRILSLGALLSSLVGSAWAQTPPSTVGVIQPPSGGWSQQGQHVRQPIQTMTVLTNQSGGVLEIVVREDESTLAGGMLHAHDPASQDESVILERFVNKMHAPHNQTPYMTTAMYGAALQIWNIAANESKELDRGRLPSAFATAPPETPS